MRPPVCEICDERLDPAAADGGLVRFQPDDHSRDWRRRAAETPGFVGHPPDAGWFCAAHIGPARAAAATLGFGDAVRAMRETARSAGSAAEPGLADELAGGRLVTSDQADLQWVEWDLAPTDAPAFAATLRSTLPPLFEALGLGSAPALEHRTDRTWTPMDGAQPPWCPFTDTTVEAGVALDGTQVVLEVVLNHWNDDEVANASATLSIGRVLTVSAYATNGAGRHVDTLRLRRPVSAQVIAVVATLVR